MRKFSAKYKVIYTRSAYKDIKKLDNVARKKIKKKIELFIQDQIKYSRKLTDQKIGNYRWRIGNYRVVFDNDKYTIVVLRVGHRREICK